ncbi:unnamed protein product [Nesidiocoris tenuis]|uniref:Uncharacterized protein n=1 Tax=Nesidiocoris tenuis TaxID=355587 RepID=A0A6H5GFD5_9HEMI|nr:unnamed protein product [Nesidiocoris tenuis]
MFFFEYENDERKVLERLLKHFEEHNVQQRTGCHALQYHRRQCHRRRVRIDLLVRDHQADPDADRGDDGERRHVQDDQDGLCPR